MISYNLIVQYVPLHVPAVRLFNNNATMILREFKLYEDRSDTIKNIL